VAATLWAVKQETTESEEVGRSILGRFEVPVNESLWFHAMEIGDPLGTLKTPAHGMGGSVTWERFSTMQNCGQRTVSLPQRAPNKHRTHAPHISPQRPRNQCKHSFTKPVVEKVPNCHT
jgi:hypothetical protein